MTVTRWFAYGLLTMLSMMCVLINVKMVSQQLVIFWTVATVCSSIFTGWIIKGPATTKSGVALFTLCSMIFFSVALFYFRFGDSRNVLVLLLGVALGVLTLIGTVFYIKDEERHRAVRTS